ncbi:MAG: sigma-70 family RNA polymerase sigma factor [Anaerolineales bacterium]|nr:sigma-70 family RNA polymerase sigma factor [Anaerolineales bacterium]
MVEETYTSLDDAQLIALAQQGEIEAFGELYTRYLDAIYRYIRLRVHNDRVAEDLTEEVFLRAFKALGDYEERGLPFSAFLFRVTRNLLVDHYRRQPEETSLEDVDQIPMIAAGLDDILIEEEQRKVLHQAIFSLPPEYQEVIRLRVILGMSTTNAAAWMDRSEGAIRVLLHRALKALRNQMIVNGK